MAKTVPSGKLTDTWARSYDDYPSSRTFSYRDDNLDDEYYSDGIYVGYRYFDTFGIMPLYCFGYGKGYTDFSLVTKEVTADEKLVKVEVEVTNIGKVYPGREDRTSLLFGTGWSYGKTNTGACRICQDKASHAGEKKKW